MADMDYSNTSAELDSWFGLRTPTFMFITLSLYLLFVLKVGPAYMKNRAPYKLKTFIQLYNIAQVVACVYIVCQIFSITSIKIFYFWKCSIFAQNTPQEYSFNRVVYFTFWLKVIELTETVVFVLRKKQNQVSFLHVFHHSSTISLVYCLLKYYRGGSALYPIMLNTNVHVLMYSYYFVAAVSEKSVLEQLMPLKKSITTIQMIQFVLILMQAVSMFRTCELPRPLVCYYCACVCVIFYGFYDFYKKSYNNEQNCKNS